MEILASLDFEDVEAALRSCLLKLQFADACLKPARKGAQPWLARSASYLEHRLRLLLCARAPPARSRHLCADARLVTMSAVAAPCALERVMRCGPSH